MTTSGLHIGLPILLGVGVSRRGTFQAEACCRICFGRAMYANYTGGVPLATCSRRECMSAWGLLRELRYAIQRYERGEPS